METDTVTVERRYNVGDRDAIGRAKFAKGNPGGPSRKGIPNFYTRVVKEAILQAGENVGNRLVDEANALEIAAAKKANRAAVLAEKQGLISFLEWAALNHTAAYLSLLGRVMPTQVEHTPEDLDVPYKTVEEVKQALQERGLPVERFFPLLIAGKVTGFAFRRKRKQKMGRLTGLGNELG